MKCEKMQENIPMLLNSSLNKDDEREALNHLINCEECRVELAFWTKIASASKSYESEFSQESKKKILNRLSGKKNSIMQAFSSSLKVYFKVINTIRKF